jgi:hypothetical protein
VYNTGPDDVSLIRAAIRSMRGKLSAIPSSATKTFSTRRRRSVEKAAALLAPPTTNSAGRVVAGSARGGAAFVDQGLPGLLIGGRSGMGAVASRGADPFHEEIGMMMV